jgi:hypothetical protein
MKRKLNGGGAVRIISIRAQNIKPLKNVFIPQMSNVVVIAGPNGVGKTRLTRELLQHIQGAQSSNFSVEVEATCDAERTDWKKERLDTSNVADKDLLRITLQKNRKRANFTSSFLNFESNRTIQQIVPYNWDWNYGDPFEEEVGWNFGMHNMTSRFQDVLHSIFRKIRSRRDAIATEVENLIAALRHSAGPEALKVVTAQVSDTPGSSAESRKRR